MFTSRCATHDPSCGAGPGRDSVALMTNIVPVKIPDGEDRRANWPVVAAAVAILAGGALYAKYQAAGGKPLLLLLGGAMGLTLYQAAFGFTSGWRDLVLVRRGAGMRAQMALFAIATVLFLPALSAGSLFGQPVIPASAPVGVAMLLGAAMFGFGMQLGNGCASGTLYTVGGGSSRMIITLAFFMAGSVLGSNHLPWWIQLPRLSNGTVQQLTGPGPAIALQLAVLAGIAALTVHLEKRRYGSVLWAEAGRVGERFHMRQILFGPWALLWGALLLALFNFATLALTGHAWSISFGYALWGAKALGALGVDVSQNEFWTWSYPARALKGSFFAEDTSVMNFGILFGATLAAGLAGRFGKIGKISWRSACAAAIGGMLMGYGARLASGCNVGAMFSGIASGSWHGWAWMFAGFAGSYAGIKLRPWFDL